MSPDEMQRTMQFVLSQQAKFASDFDRLTEKVERVTDAMIGLTGIAGRLERSQVTTDQRLDQLGQRVDQLQAMIARHLRDDHGYPRPEGR